MFTKNCGERRAEKGGGVREKVKGNPLLYLINYLTLRCMGEYRYGAMHSYSRFVREVPQPGSCTPTERSPRSHCTGVGEKQIIASDKNRAPVVQPYHSHNTDRKLCPRQHGKRLQHSGISIQVKDTGNVMSLLYLKNRVSFHFLWYQRTPLN